MLKNIFAKDEELFFAGLDRYLKSNSKLGFDLGTFIKHTPKARQLANEKLNDFKRLDAELERY